jgi:hypothetical protein
MLVGSGLIWVVDAARGMSRQGIVECSSGPDHVGPVQN